MLQYVHKLANNLHQCRLYYRNCVNVRKTPLDGRVFKWLAQGFIILILASNCIYSNSLRYSFIENAFIISSMNGASL